MTDKRVPVVRLWIDPDWLAQNPTSGYAKEWIGDKLAFAYVDLEDGIEESADVNYADTDVVGRAEMYKTYAGTGNREIPIVFKFRVHGATPGAEGPTDLDIYKACKAEVVDPTLWLEGLKYPYTGPDGLSHGPPPCFLAIGSLFGGRVLATAVQIQWQAPFSPVPDLMPYGADVTCTFSVVRRVINNFFEGSRGGVTRGGR